MNRRALFLLPVVVGCAVVASAAFGDDNREIWHNDSHRMLCIQANKVRFSTKWCFVVDSSHSTWNIAGRVISALDGALNHPTDQLRFCVYTFNNRGMHKFRNWVDASQDEFDGATNFIRDNRGVSSWVTGAMHDALRQPVPGLTIIVISDGGFTEPFGDVRTTINDGQSWRDQQGFGPATICAIGLENMLSRDSRPPYPKDANSVCQRRMFEIGSDHGGGVYYVQPRESRVDVTAQFADQNRH